MEDRTEGDAGVRSTQYPVQGTEDDVAEQPGERRGGHRFEENWSPPVGPRVTEPGSSRGLLLCTVAGTNIEIHADAWLERDSDVRIGVVRAGDAKDDDAEDELVVPVGRGLSDLFVSVVLPELGTGGVVTGDGRWLARLDSSAQRTLRADAWNDVRVRLAKGRLTVQVNGWPAVDALMDNVLKKGDRHLADPSIPQGLDSNSDPVPVFQQAAGAYRCALVTPNDGSEGRWRFVRTRVLPENARPFSREAQPSATQVRAAQSTERDVDEHEVRDGQVDVSRREDGGWKIEDRTERAGQVGKPALPQILAAWVERQGRLAEGRLAEGQFEWQVLRRNQSESFGTLASTSEDAGENDRTGEMMTISFDKHGFRLDGESVPSVGLKQRAWAAASGSSGAAADHAAFQAALRNRFSEFGSSMPESLTSVPYRVLVDATREVHAWDVGNAPLSGNARSLKRDSPLFQQKEQTGFGETRLHYINPAIGSP